MKTAQQLIGIEGALLALLAQ